MCKGVNVYVAGSLGMSAYANAPLPAELRVYLWGSGGAVSEGAPGGVNMCVCECSRVSEL